MDAPRRPHPADPEFDPSPISTVRLRDFDPLDHQRLVINPFLGVFGAIVLREVVVRLAGSPSPPLAVAGVLPMVLLPYLIEYHCLDCGQTGRYLFRRRHACSGVVARWHEGHRSPVPFPSGWSQLVVWGWVIGSAALLYWVATLEGGAP